MATPVIPAEITDKVVLSQTDIASRVAELGKEIAVDHSESDLALVTILKGGLVFLADLSRSIDLPLTLDFMAVSSFVGGTPGTVRITKDLDDSIEGKNVIVVEDIIDTGLTLNYILKNLRSRRPASLEVCALLDKDVRRIVDLPITYCGFSIPDRFVVGYGLDHRGLYRNLPYVAEVREEVFGL